MYSTSMSSNLFKYNVNPYNAFTEEEELDFRDLPNRVQNEHKMKLNWVLLYQRQDNSNRSIPSKLVKHHRQLIMGQKGPVETVSWKSSLLLAPQSHITLTDNSV